MEVDLGELPEPLQYLEIEVPDTISSQTMPPETLGRTWQRNQAATRRAGDEWLHSGRTALLQVPSAIVPQTWNTLINPQHPESAQIQIIQVHRHRLDPRLLG